MFSFKHSTGVGRLAVAPNGSVALVQIMCREPTRSCKCKHALIIFEITHERQAKLTCCERLPHFLTERKLSRPNKTENCPFVRHNNQSWLTPTCAKPAGRGMKEPGTNTMVRLSSFSIYVYHFATMRLGRWKILTLVGVILVPWRLLARSNLIKTPTVIAHNFVSPLFSLLLLCFCLD